MADSMKIRATLKGDVTEVRMLVIHPMETGRRKNDFGDVEPAHFIQLVTVRLNGKPILEAQWGTGVSKNPYLTFRHRGAAAGDKLTVEWVDNKGQIGSGETQVVAG